MLRDMRRRLSNSDKADGSKSESTIIGRLVFFWKHLVYLPESSYSYSYPSYLPVMFRSMFSIIWKWSCTCTFSKPLNNLFFYVLFYFFTNNAYIYGGKQSACQEINEKKTGGILFQHRRYRHPT